MLLELGMVFSTIDYLPTFVIWLLSFLYAQVDLFFYREPEETKQAEEEETAAIDYANVAPEYNMNLTSDQWPTQISDSQWAGGEVQKPITPVPYFPEG